jgi:hypothetical protein
MVLFLSRRVQHGTNAYDELLGVSNPRIPLKLDGFVVLGPGFPLLVRSYECLDATL